MEGFPRVYPSIHARLLPVLASKHWMAWGVTVAVVCVIVLSPPLYDLLFLTDGLDSGYAALAHHVTDPFHVYPDPASHEAKLSFRITPVMAYGLLGTGKVVVLLFQFIYFVVSLYVFLQLAYRATGDRLMALLVLIGYCGTYPAAVAFQWDILGVFFDGLALCLVFCALWVRHPLGVAFFVLAASFTDERAALACLLVPLYHLVEPVGKRRPTNLMRGWRAPRPLAAVTALLAYGLGRMALASHFGASSPVSIAETIGYLQRNWRVLPLATVSVLETYWILIVAGIFLAAKYYGRLVCVCMVAWLAVVVLAAHMVADVTRSLTYVAPAIPLALLILGRWVETRVLGELTFWASLGALLFPTIYVEAHRVLWVLPLPIKVVAWLVH